ncbi:ferric reductase transmembrane component 5 [Fusarium longipes]|uniref:Ferric reductase transmembrane component 5 n=1 Tax=Fusarium longipes TaxID=694270 RepID=A0A395T5B9_9HYPO|nr:ferric reductase transmembrane component 5 [Fusarium longipes]
MRSYTLNKAACIIALLTSGFECVHASLMDPKLCGKACRQTFRTLKFADAPEGAFFARQECTSRLYQTSLHLCWDIHCNENVWIDESNVMNQTCQDMYGSYLLSHDVIDGITDDEKNQMARFNATIPERLHRYNMLMQPSNAYYDIWVRTLAAHDYIWSYHSYYGWAMGIFWAVVTTIGTVNRILTQVSHTQVNKSPWLKRNVIVPATFGRRCVQDFGSWGTLPPRIQTMTLALFVILNLVCSIHGYEIFEGYGYYPSVWLQILRHVSDRTGIIAFANFPLIWLFGMRNDIMLWITGWDFKTYNNFHRWIGRIASLQAVIHSIGYIIIIFQRGGWEYFWKISNLTFWWTGELATVFICLLFALSFFWVRRTRYEFFLISHIVLSALVLLTMLGHVSIFRGAYDPLVWVPVTIWLLDRVTRAGRIFAFNPKFWKTTALVTYNQDAHMIRVVVPASSSLYSIKPGTFYHLTVLDKWNFWESHPFTVASTPRPNQSLPSEQVPLLDYMPSASPEMEAEHEKSQHEMTFLIRPYDSFTRRLQEYAEKEQPKPAKIRVAIDGPYGKTLPLEHFDKVLFIVGGSGIAVPLSYLDKLTSSVKGPTVVEIHWAVRQPALATDVLNNELYHVLVEKKVRVSIYVTGTSGIASGGATTRDHPEWRDVRLNVEETIDRILGRGGRGSLAVVTSGPAKMADDSRSAVVARTVDSLPRIEYFEESFQW